MRTQRIQRLRHKWADEIEMIWYQIKAILDALGVGLVIDVAQDFLEGHPKLKHKLVSKLGLEPAEDAD